MTLFISLLSLDLQRKYANRVDIFCCLKMTNEYQVEQNSEVERQHSTTEHNTVFERFFGNYFIPFILKKPMKIIILGLVLLDMHIRRIIRLNRHRRTDLRPRTTVLILRCLRLNAVEHNLNLIKSLLC